ncbi:XrtY-associated glycosyltransferase XYAG1 [Pedobacter sp. UBA4863]|uniref:XrtY-associated glycosyltransferase XYAG1 n=1 Tax=Pedobacter sp. UBA4863 TaxID=1947060 RepID=UPI0025E7D761|nr:glycosyltransferase [Pedobacter sp. UBA4863]
MKIIQICAAYKPAYIYGGPTMSVAKLSEELVKAGKEVIVLTTTANGKEELNVPIGQAQLVEGVPVYYFKRWTKDHTHFSPSLFWFLHKLITKEKKASKKKQLMIHIHAWWNLVSIFSCLVAKWHGVKVILSPRGMLTNYSLSNKNSKFKDAIHLLLGKRLLKYCHIHATSTKERIDIEQICENKGISIIPNFVHFPATTTVKTTGESSFKILYLSRIEEKKGIELLFNALTDLNFKYTLTVIGTGNPSYITQLKALSTELGIEQHINWLGKIDGEDKFTYIHSHDLFVLTSYNENFANVVIESLAMGTPVLISEHVGLVSYIQENDLGWICKTEIKSIAQNISMAFLDKEKRVKIENNAPQIIRENFSKSNLISQYLNHLYIY